MEYKVKEDVINAVLGYLANRPYAESAQLIAALQTSEKIDTSKDVEVKSKPKK